MLSTYKSSVLEKKREYGKINLYESSDYSLSIHVPTFFEISDDSKYDVLLTMDKQELIISDKTYCARAYIISFKHDDHLLTLSFGGLIGRFKVGNNMSIEILKQIVTESVDTPIYIQISESVG